MALLFSCLCVSGGLPSGRPTRVAWNVLRRARVRLCSLDAHAGARLTRFTPHLPRCRLTRIATVA